MTKSTKANKQPAKRVSTQTKPTNRIDRKEIQFGELKSVQKMCI